MRQACVPPILSGQTLNCKSISHAEFENLRKNTLKDNDLIARNKGNMWFGTDDRYHCLLVYDKEQGDGLLVESEGYDYARYAQYIPQAKIIYDTAKVGKKGKRKKLFLKFNVKLHFECDSLYHSLLLRILVESVHYV